MTRLQMFRFHRTVMAAALFAVGTTAVATATLAVAGAGEVIARAALPQLASLSLVAWAPWS